MPREFPKENLIDIDGHFHYRKFGYTGSNNRNAACEGRQSRDGMGISGFNRLILVCWP